MRRVYLLFGIVLSLCLLAGPVWSQTTGKITGKMTDPNGEPLPGANVVIEGTRFGATTDAEGIYVILGVEPGFYELKASMVGYEAVIRTNVQVAAYRTTEADFTLRESAIEAAEIVVTAGRPLIEVDRTGSEAKISEKEIEQLPILRETRDHLHYVAGVDPVRNSGINGVIIRRSDNFRIQQLQAWTFDGIELTLLDNGTSGSLLWGQQYNNTNVTAIGEMAVVRGGQSASQAQNAFGVVNIITREGTRVLHGGLDVRIEPSGKRHHGPNVYDATPGQQGGANGMWRDKLKWNDPDWVNETDPVTGKQIHVKQDYEGAVGHLVEGWLTGSLGENATFVLSARTGRSKQTFPAPQRTSLRQRHIFGKLSFTPSDNLKLKFGYHDSYEPTWGRGDQRGVNSNLFLVRDRGHTGYERRWKNRIVYLTATHTLGPKTFHEFQIGFYGTNVDTTEETDGATSSWRRDESGNFNVDRKIRNLQVDHNRRYNFRYAITSQMSRWNLVKTGFTHQIFHNANWHLQQGSPSGATIWVMGKDGVPGTRYVVHRFAWYAEDKIEFRGMVVNVGLRYDAMWGGPRKTLAGFYKATPQHRTYKAFLTRTPRAQGKALAYWSPRVGVSHPITARSAIRFSFGRYYKPTSFGQIYSESWATNDLLNHPNLDGTWGNGGKAGGGWYLDHINRSPSGSPNLTEFEVSGAWNFLSNYVLDMATYYRRTERATGGNNRYYVDPVRGQGQERTQGPFARAESKGFEMAVYKPLSQNFAFRFSVDVGWSFYYFTGAAPVLTHIYPDSTYIAGPNYFLVDTNDDPVLLTDTQIRDLGHKANETIRKVREQLTRQEQVTDILTPLKPLSEWPGISGEDRSRPEIQGLWYSSTWRSLKNAAWGPPAPTTQATFQFLWSTPSDWGPGPTVGGSKLLGGIQANLVWRFNSGVNFAHTPPDNPKVVDAFRSGPMFVRADLNFQKTFEAGTGRPTLYVEVFNLFNTYLDQTRNANYVRWGLKLPTPNDSNYNRYGDPSPFRGGTPRYVNLGVRVRF